MFSPAFGRRGPQRPTRVGDEAIVLDWVVGTSFTPPARRRASRKPIGKRFAKQLALVVARQLHDLFNAMDETSRRTLGTQDRQHGEQR